MAATRNTSNPGKPATKRPPAKTPEARENQMISLAFDVVEERLRNGTATSQETTHFLKLGSLKHQAEMRKLEAAIELDKAKIAASDKYENGNELNARVIKALSLYQGEELDETDV